MAAHTDLVGMDSWVAILMLFAFLVGMNSCEKPHGAAPPEGQRAPVPLKGAPGKVHECAGAGRWFPADPAKLAEAVDGFLAAPATELGRAPLALIVPHAGYPYSGAVAGRAYATLKGHSYSRVIVLGPNHTAPLRGASVLRVDSYRTPLGDIPVDIEARDALLKCPVVAEQPAAHLSEHSVENQLPMLQRAIGSFKMVEVLVGQMSSDDRRRLADAIRPLAGEATLIVASSDFTHYGPNYEFVPFKDNIAANLKSMNDQAVQEILQVDAPGFSDYLDQTGDTICGQMDIGVLLELLQPWDDICGTQLAYDTSGNLTGDWTNSVTYAAIAFWRTGGELTQAERATVLRLAREAVTLYLTSGEKLRADPAKYELTPALRAPGAAFVTLENAGELRGCIGHVEAIGPLYQSVIDNACRACMDPRFTNEPVTAKEVPSLHIEISVLAPIRRLLDPRAVQVGRDGLMMERGYNRGLLLPQVPVEQGWDRERFLEGTCQKAGLPRDAWKDPKTAIHRFHAQVFGEAH